jgi:hypothetical protein
MRRTDEQTYTRSSPTDSGRGIRSVSMDINIKYFNEAQLQFFLMSTSVRALTDCFCRIKKIIKICYRACFLVGLQVLEF